MTDFIHGHLNYWFTIVLMLIGFYGMLFKGNLLKKLIGMSVFQTSIVLFYVAGAVNKEATVPVVTKSIPTEPLMNYLNPIPHTLMLTAIVVGVATLGVGFALLSMIYREHGTLEEDEILEKLK